MGVMDLEAASATSGGTSFRRYVAALVGLAALAGAALGTLEMDTRKMAERAQFMASRISVDVYGRETAHQIVTAAQAGVLQRAEVHEVTQASDLVAEAASRARERASARLAAAAASVGRPPDIGGGVDAATRTAVASDERSLEELERGMARELRAARRLSGRRSTTVFALSLVALAGVLAGLGAVLGENRAGGVAIATGAVALVLAIASGTLAMLA